MTSAEVALGSTLRTHQPPAKPGCVCRAEGPGSVTCVPLARGWPARSGAGWVERGKAAVML